MNQSVRDILLKKVNIMKVKQKRLNAYILYCYALILIVIGIIVAENLSFVEFLLWIVIYFISVHYGTKWHSDSKPYFHDN